jgi:hypothetical protein
MPRKTKIQSVTPHQAIHFGLIAAGLLALVIFSLGFILQLSASNNAGSIGKVTLDANVSQWNVGSGQFNGEFVIAEGQGVELGLRAQKRGEGLLEVSGTNGNRVGVYQATTGVSSGTNNATWNYDFHVDLSKATGNAKGKDLNDYELVLEQNYTTQNLFGVLGSDPVQLPLNAEPVGVCVTSTFTSTLCQQSWNPGFGNTDFDANAEGTYDLRLVLTPKTFNGQPLAVAVKVNVSNE